MAEYDCGVLAASARKMRCSSYRGGFQVQMCWRAAKSTEGVSKTYLALPGLDPPPPPP